MQLIRQRVLEHAILLVPSGPFQAQACVQQGVESANEDHLFIQYKLCLVALSKQVCAQPYHGRSTQQVLLL